MKSIERLTSGAQRACNGRAPTQNQLADRKLRTRNPVVGNWRRPSPLYEPQGFADGMRRSCKRMHDSVLRARCLYSPRRACLAPSRPRPASQCGVAATGYYRSLLQNAAALAIYLKAFIQVAHRTDPRFYMKPCRNERFSYEYHGHWTNTPMSSAEFYVGQVCAEPIRRNNKATSICFLHWGLDTYQAKDLRIAFGHGSSQWSKKAPVWVALQKGPHLTYSAARASWFYRIGVWSIFPKSKILHLSALQLYGELAERLTIFTKVHNRRPMLPV